MFHGECCMKHGGHVAVGIFLSERNDLISFSHIFQFCTYIFLILQMSYCNVAMERLIEKKVPNVKSLGDRIFQSVRSI